MHQVSAWRRGARGGTVLGRATAGTCLLSSEGRVPPRASCKDKGTKLPQVYEGTCPRPGRSHPSLQQSRLTQPLFPCQGSHQPGPLLRDAGCQEEEGLLHQEALAARLALRGPVAARVFPCHGGMWGRGHAAGWPSRPRAQLQLSHFFTVGGGKGHLAPHHCLITGQHLHGLKLDRAPLCTPGSPGLSTTGILSAPDPQESCSHVALGPPGSCVQTLLGCSVRRGSSCGGFGVSQVLGCRVSAPGGSCRDTAPGPRCSGPGSVLASPCCCLGPSQPPPALEWSPQTGGMKGRDS